MKKGKAWLMFAVLVAVSVLLCACGKKEKTVIWRDEDAQTELGRKVYNQGEAEPGFTAPEKDGKIFDKWIVLVDEGSTKVYQASYNPVEVEEPTPTPTETPVPTPTEEPASSYPLLLPNGITVIGGTAGVDGQNCENLFDDDRSTAWCVDMNANDRAYVEWSTPLPVEIRAFYRTTSSDSKSNPQVWKLFGSENGVDWFSCLDTGETDVTTEPNGHYIVYIVFHNAEGEAITPKGKYFRFEVERTEGSPLLSLMEIGVTSEE